MRLFLAFVVACLTVSPATAESPMAQAKAYMDFWQPVEGTWDIVNTVEGQEAVHGVWRVEASPSGSCRLSYLKVGEQAVNQSMAGYDPEKSAWLSVTFDVAKESDDPICSHNWIFIDLSSHKQLATGVVVQSEGTRALASGKVAKRTAVWTFPVVSKNKIVLEVTDRVHNGEAQPKRTIIFERRKQVAVHGYRFLCCQPLLLPEIRRIPNGRRQPC